MRRVIAMALASSGLHPELVCCLSGELSGLRANITIPGAGSTGRFPLERGGKQGGVETPDEFNILLQVILEPLVQSWSERGFGFVPEDNSTPVHHFVWAGNIYILGSSRVQFQTMCEELTTAIYGHGLRWKRTSLEYILAGPSDAAIT